MKTVPASGATSSSYNFLDSLRNVYLFRVAHVASLPQPSTKVLWASAVLLGVCAVDPLAFFRLREVSCAVDQLVGSTNLRIACRSRTASGVDRDLSSFLQVHSSGSAGATAMRWLSVPDDLVDLDELTAQDELDVQDEVSEKLAPAAQDELVEWDGLD